MDDGTFLMWVFLATTLVTTVGFGILITIYEWTANKVKEARQRKYHRNVLLQERRYRRF